MHVNSIRSSTAPFQAVSIRPIPDQLAGDTKKMAMPTATASHSLV
jgi:hypothetical protein